MKGKIAVDQDGDGHIMLDRGYGGFKPTLCPYNNRRPCGDWCPLFGEPEIMSDGTQASLKICQKVFIFDEFQDNRKKT